MMHLHQMKKQIQSIQPEKTIFILFMDKNSYRVIPLKSNKFNRYETRCKPKKKFKRKIKEN